MNNMCLVPWEKRAILKTDKSVLNIQNYLGIGILFISHDHSPLLDFSNNYNGTYKFIKNFIDVHLKTD